MLEFAYLLVLALAVFAYFYLSRLEKRHHDARLKKIRDRLDAIDRRKAEESTNGKGESSDARASDS